MSNYIRNYLWAWLISSDSNRSRYVCLGALNLSKRPNRKCLSTLIVIMWVDHTLNGPPFFREQHLPTSPSFRFCLSHTIWFDPLHDPSSASTLKLPQRSGMGWGEKQCLWSTITGSTTKVLKLQSIRDRQMNGRTDISTSFLVHMIPPLRESYSRPQRIIIIIVVGVSACPSVCPWKHTPPYDYECALSS